MKNHTYFVLIFPLLLCLLLVSCQSKEKGPSLYEVMGDSVPSINKLLDGKGGVLSSMDLPNDSKDEASGGQETSQKSEPNVYHYTDLPDGGQTIKAYVDALTASEVGFEIVSGSGKQTEPPDFSAQEGSLTLSRANFDLRKNLLIDLRWEKTDLTAKVSLSDGTGASAEDGAAGASEALTAEDAVAYLKSYSPSYLGLTGESMDAYKVYYMDGKAMVNGVTCHRLRVYQISPPEGSNAILSTYLLSADKSVLYRLNANTNQLERLSLP